MKDRLAQLAREKLGILSREKQLQLERKRRAMAFLNQIGGKISNNEILKSELCGIFLTKLNMICTIEGEETTSAKSPKKEKNTSLDDKTIEINSSKQMQTSDHSDSSDSVKFVMATTSSSICAAVTQTAQKRRHIRSNRKSSESDDVVEIPSNNSRSKTRSRSR